MHQTTHSNSSSAHFPIPRSTEAASPQVFHFQQRTVRMVEIDGIPWFIGSDVTDILGYADGRHAVNALPGRMRNTVPISHGTPGNPNRAAINESGVYRLVMRSNLPDAEQFQDWLAEEVLPSIRRTGNYGIPQQRAEMSPRDLAMLVIAEADRADAAEATVAVLAPAAESWNELAEAKGDYKVADAAKILSRDPNIIMGQNRLFAKMNELGWIFRDSNKDWHAYQTAVDTGRISTAPRYHLNPRTGEKITDAPKILVTAKGISDLRHILGGTAPLIPDAIESVPRQRNTTRPGDNRPLVAILLCLNC